MKGLWIITMGIAVIVDLWGEVSVMDEFRGLITIICVLFTGLLLGMEISLKNDAVHAKPEGVENG